MNTEEKLLEEINEGIKETNTLLHTLLEAIEQGGKRSSPTPRKKALSQQEQDDIEDSMMSLDEWYQSFGEDPYPAKYINVSGEPFTKQEADWVYNRLVEIADMKPKVNNGTHTFKHLPKTYCKAIGNTVNCFACVPIKG